jgi:hypothetical protein
MGKVSANSIAKTRGGSLTRAAPASRPPLPRMLRDLHDQVIEASSRWSRFPGHAKHYRADRAQSNEQSRIGRCSCFEREWFHIRVYPSFIGLLPTSSNGLSGRRHFDTCNPDCSETRTIEIDRLIVR